MDLNRNTNIAALLVGLCATHLLPASSPPANWHIAEAPLRCRISNDLSHVEIPNVYLSELKTQKNSTRGRLRYHNPNQERKITDRHFHSRIRGKLYSQPFVMIPDAVAIYNLERRFQYFTATIGLVDGAAGNARITFQVLIDDKNVFTSAPLSVDDAAQPLRLRIPPYAQQIKLVVKASGSTHRLQAVWADAGFLIAGRYARNAAVSICPAGFNPEQHDIRVVTPSGTTVPSEIIWAREGDPLDILFESSQTAGYYYVYFAPKADNDSKTTSPATIQPHGGLILETRRIGSHTARLHSLEGFRQIWQGASLIGKSFTDGVCHAFPLHHLPSDRHGRWTKRSGINLYKYTGYFFLDEPADIHVATTSHWSSYILIDGQEVVSWTGKHGYGGGRRAEHRGLVSLRVGIHKFEYLNCSPWNRKFLLAAWRRSDEAFRVMLHSDFLPLGRYYVTDFEYRLPLEQPPFPFAWEILDDFRVHPFGRAFVALRFKALGLIAEDEMSFEWHFDDNTTARGPIVNHIFFRPGLRNVTLKVLKKNQPFRETTQTVHIHPRWNKLDMNRIDESIFDHAVRDTPLYQMPLPDIVNLHNLAVELDNWSWRRHLAHSLIDKSDQLDIHPDYIDAYLRIVADCRSHQLRLYEQAHKLIRVIYNAVNDNHRFWDAVLLDYAGIALILGDADKAGGLLNGIRPGKLDRARQNRYPLVLAETHLALGREFQAREVLERHRDQMNPSDQLTANIRHTGLLQNARQLINTAGDDPHYLDDAMAKIDTVLAEDPPRLFHPTLLQLRLDIFLARQEYIRALRLTDRLQNLTLGPSDQVELTFRRLQALCALDQLDKARETYDHLKTEFPYSPAVNHARQLLLNNLQRPQ